jgi:hypothetical protein
LYFLGKHSMSELVHFSLLTGDVFQHM